MRADIRYGKGQVTLYRSYAHPLEGITPIPESTFTGRANTLFAADVDVEVFGDHFLASYTEGDNSQIVATDTMKNFILGAALVFDGATLEELLAFLARRFLATYPEMGRLRFTGREVPFDPAPVPQEAGFAPSNVLFSRSHNDHATAMLDVQRIGADFAILDHRCGRVGLQLIKVTGSAFTRFVRDGYTTLPERVDRPLFIYLDVHWRYSDPSQAIAPNHSAYIAAEQVRDCVAAVFERFVSQSIQHLVYEMGTVLLERFPQMAEVSFEAQNRLWDTAVTAENNAHPKVYCDPRPPYGMIHLTLLRDDR